MDAEARRWLEDSLLQDGRPRLATAKAIELVKSQPPAFQIAILMACVERLPILREGWSERDVFRMGEQLYAVAAKLYDPKLPFQEADLCRLLRNSRHDCGHGCDVQAPLDLAMSYLADHDASHELLSAVAAYCDGLKGIGSIQAQTVKRKASILLLLDRSGTLGRRSKGAWSRCFTSDLEAMRADERRAWQALLLSFKLNERVELPNTFRKLAQKFISGLGEEQMLSRMEHWWPASGSVCKLDTGGSHLLKHLVWLLETVNGESAFKPRCHQLVCRLSDVEWKPKQPAAKVVCAAANYLVTLPRSIAWEPLQRLRTMAPSRDDWIRELVEEYDKNT